MNQKVFNSGDPNVVGIGIAVFGIQMVKNSLLVEWLVIQVRA